MSIYTCVIIDDEPLAIDVIEKYIETNPKLQLIKKYLSANEIDIANFKSALPDILFLDIEMPELNGLDFLKSLPQSPITILTTAYREYAIEGFDLGVIDYLVKPIHPERFQISVNRAIDFLELSAAKEQLIQLENNTSSNLIIKSGTKQISIELNSITHLQGLKDYVIIFTHSSKYVVLGYLKIIESRLPAGMFTRVHKSFIVANGKIKYIHKNKIEIDRYQIPIGRMYKEKIEATLLKGTHL